MKIIRWLLSHIVLVLLIVVVIYGYMFWGRLLDSDTPGGKAIAYLSNKFAPVNVGTANEGTANADEQDLVAGLNAGEVSRGNSENNPVKDVKNTAENNVSTSRGTVVVNSETSMSSRPGDDSVNGAPSITEDSGVTENSAKTNKEALVSSNALEQFDDLDEGNAAVDVNHTSSLTSRQSKTAVNDTPLTIGDAAANADASAVETGKDGFVSPEVEEKLNNVDAIGETVAASQLNAEVKASWITARASYHQRNYELSEKSYQQVIDNTEDNYDAYGELGNVYFNQGKNAQAASAYYEAAAILVRIGQRSRAESLIGLLWRLDPSKADELQKLIDSAASQA